MWRPFLSGTHVAFAYIPHAVAAVDALHAATMLRRWNSNIKMTKQLKRMFDRRAGSKKKKIFPGPVSLGNTSSDGADLNPNRKPLYTEGQKRRAHQVGRVLYNNIVHLINSGELSPKLPSLSVEIVRVKVVPDFSAVNVYWLSSGTKKDETVQTLLSENAGQLRHLLTSLHVLGSIPHINFVRDNSQAHYLEVEALLKTADFGPEFVPTRLDSSIRENILRDRMKDNLPSPEDKLQAVFSSLSVTGVDPLQRRVNGPVKDFHTGRELQGEKAIQDNGDTVPFFEESKMVPREDLQQSSDIQTSPIQPSSLEVAQLGRQYLSTTPEVASNTLKPCITAVNEEHTKSISSSFRDDLYKVPHSELLKKIVLRKQKAGLRPGLQDWTKASEVFTPTVQSAGLKSLLKKKVKTKGRTKWQSDFYGVDDDYETDFVRSNSEDAFTGYDGDASDEEINEFPTVDDPLSRK